MLISGPDVGMAYECLAPQYDFPNLRGKLRCPSELNGVNRAPPIAGSPLRFDRHRLKDYDGDLPGTNYEICCGR